MYAISDEGSDACFVGTSALIVGETGRYAHLIGYDTATTKSHRIPIVTVYLKVNAQNGIPILLKINEAAYKALSPITLLSEYQIMENGHIVDLVATKHRTGQDTYGTQSVVLNKEFYVAFEDRGGLKGCKILPIEDGDVDEVDPKYCQESSCIVCWNRKFGIPFLMCFGILKMVVTVNELDTIKPI